MENKRSSWGSNLGFLMAAVGSAVGLGNIWGFPYKMGRSGGFTFLLIYLLLAVFVGLVIMASELALGRKTGLGVVGAYQAVSKKFGWVGWLGVLSPFLIMSFYAVLGGYCIQYMSLNMAELSFNLSDIFGAPLAGGATFGAMLDNPFGCAVFTALFLFICMMIVKGGVAVVVTLAMSWVGLMVINSLLVLPAASARNVAKNVRQYHLFSVLGALVASVAGLILAYYLGCSAGATIALLLALFFAVTFALRRTRA